MHLSRRALLAVAAGVAGATLSRTTTAQESAWTLLDDGSGPLARWDHVLLADATSEQLIVFGGRDGAGTAFGDAWAFDLADHSWTLLEQSGPSPRFGIAAAVLPDGSGFLLYGGQSAADFFTDLWQFDFGTSAWTLLDDGTAVAPSPRYGLGGDFDRAGRFIVSHGFTFEGRFDDTWAFDPATGAWTDISPSSETRPLRRCLHEVTALDGGAHLVLYAGCSSGYGPCPQGDTWLFDTGTEQWSQLAPEVAPSARSNPAVVRMDGGLLLIGGSTVLGPAADVWQGTLTNGVFTWTELPAATGAIAPRSSHDAAAIGRDVYLFGGLGVDGPLADLWRFRDPE